MKRYFIIPILLIAAAFSAQAQDKKDGAINEKFYEASLREFVYQLELTDAQKAEFAPIYKRYHEEVRASFGKHEKPSGKPDSAEAAAARVKSKIERQQQTLSIRLKYVDEFAKVLEPRQLMRLFEVEGNIQHKLMARQAHPHGGQKGGPKGGFLGRPGDGQGPRPAGPRPQDFEE